VFDMLAGQRAVVFSGGLDADLLSDWHRELLETIRYSEIWLACDRRGSKSSLIRAAGILAGISTEKLRCYVLIGFGEESLSEARRRLEWVYSLGFLPFAQLYRGMKAVAYLPEWRALARKWSRPALYRTKEPARD